MRDACPNTSIIKKGDIDNLFIFLKGRLKPIFINNWDKDRAIKFLQVNNNIERVECVSGYIDAFRAYGDACCNETEAYINKLLEEERSIIDNLLTGVGGYE